MTDQTASGRRIVVGVDGSQGSKTALRWAMAQARLTAAQLETVTAWQDPVEFGYAYGAPMIFEDDTYRAIAEKVAGETTAEVAAELGQPLDVPTRVLQGHPAQVLTQAATGAQLLVVGSRGHGTFAGILLGSVSMYCVQHSPCPVVVVPS